MLWRKTIHLTRRRQIQYCPPLLKKWNCNLSSAANFFNRNDQKLTSQPIKPPPIPASSARPAGVRYFEFIGGASKKFWELSLSGDVFTVRFGRIGTLGQSQTKRFPDEAKARREAENLIAEKLKKGYVEKN